MKTKRVKSPTKWAKIKELSSWVGESICEENSRGGHAKLTIIHHCGKDKESLIEQLELMIELIKTNGKNFSS